jgi:hypothetical protein
MKNRASSGMPSPKALIRPGITPRSAFQFQFTLENVSRQFIWSFLHSHPFYNSEQVSQRYVTVGPDSVTVPPLKEPALFIGKRPKC